MKRFLTLEEDEYPHGVLTHSDILNPRPTVLSRERAKKVGKMQQERMRDEKGSDGCLLCNPERLQGAPPLRAHCDNRAYSFENSAPYLPFDQRVIFLSHTDLETRKKYGHIVHVEQIRQAEIYFLMKAIVEDGQKFASQAITSTDLPRMVAGFNIGPQAGQSIPHIHAQSGWEVMLDKINLSPTVLELYFEELRREDLIIHTEKNKHNFILTAPWTPRGQFALDLIFPKVYEIHKLTDDDLKIFSHIALLILKRYPNIGDGICNVNIVFQSSPMAREIIPVTAKFIPRVNKPAIYEMLGRDVVDTPPTTIFNEFRNLSSDWPSEIDRALKYDPVADYESIMSGNIPIVQIPAPA